MKYISRVTLFALLSTLTACTFPQKYMPSPTLTAQTGATVVGSMTTDPSPFAPNTKVILLAVDNQVTDFSWGDWNKTTLVEPGTHTLTVYICQCSAFAQGGVQDSLTMLAAFKSGGTYTIRSTIPTGGLSEFERHFVTAWIEDGTGTAIVPKAKFEVDQSNAPIAQLFEH